MKGGRYALLLGKLAIWVVGAWPWRGGDSRLIRIEFGAHD